MDERLDKWLGAGQGASWLGVEILWAREQDNSPNKGEIWKSVPLIYEESASTVHVFGEAFSLFDLRAGVLDVQNRISAALS